MDRRRFVETCYTRMASWTAMAAALPALAAQSQPKAYARALLSNQQGEPIKASQLKPLTNYIFHYPFEATPVFLLKLDQPAAAQALNTKAQDSYHWPGGVGPQRDIVAYSAICAHQLVYPTTQVSFISFRKSRARLGVADKLIHCCAEQSQYDPAQGAKVMHGPAEQPLCAVLLEHNAQADTLTAWATLGGELFDEFFRKYEFKLKLEVGRQAKNQVSAAKVVELEKFCRNSIQC